MEPWRMAYPIAGGRENDPSPPEPAPEPTPAPEPAPEPQPTATAPESFINPADLPEELKPHWRRMHGAYTKALERVKGASTKAEMVDRFWSDPDFAKQSILQWAQQHGVQVNFGEGTPAAPNGPPTPPTSTSSVPAELIQAVEAELPAELRWMARPLAASFWKAQAQTIGPLLRQTQAKEASERESQYDELAAELSEVAPGWESHEDDMTELLGFLQSPKMRDRRWGSKLELLHRLVTADAGAIATATRRMGEAARNRTTTGQPGRSTTPNIEERVRAAPTRSEAWKIAAEHAVETLRRGGGAATR